MNWLQEPLTRADAIGIAIGFFIGRIISKKMGWA